MTYITRKLYDNFLSEKDFKDIRDLFMSFRFPWYYTPVVGEKDEDYQFTFGLYSYTRPLSETYDTLEKIICDKKIKVAAVCRVKANCSVKTTEHVETGFHCDMPFECTTAIFYLNTNNGYTEFEDGTKVDAVANRLVTFPSTLKHRGVTTTDTDRKVLINFNYFESEHEYEESY